MVFNDFIIPLAWPEALTRTANGPYDKLLGSFNIYKNGYYKTGHAAFLLIDHQSGDIQYFDFGRYISPFKNGRIRSEETDPELKIEYQAKIENGIIVNLEEIILKVSINVETHGSGTLYASELSNINKELALSYIHKKQKSPYIPYGPFHIGGTNCSRFVAQTINQCIKQGGLKFLYPIYGTPSPLGNVFNTDAIHYYKIKNAQLNQLEKPNKWSQLKMIKSLLVFKANEETPISNSVNHQSSPQKNNMIPEGAQWLSGTGAGAWHYIEEEDNDFYSITRYQSNGKMDFKETFSSKSVIFSLHQNFQFTYPSHALEINILQNGKTHQFSRVLK